MKTKLDWIEEREKLKETGKWPWTRGSGPAPIMTPYQWVLVFEDCYRESIVRFDDYVRETYGVNPRTVRKLFGRWLNYLEGKPMAIGIDPIKVELAYRRLQSDNKRDN